MSIRTDIFNNHTTLLGILDEEGVSENNNRFSDVEKGISQLESRTLQTQTQLVDLSTIVAKNRADFNSFELKIKDILTSLEEGISEAKSLATGADNKATGAVETVNTILDTVHQLDNKVSSLTENLINANVDIRNLRTITTYHASQIESNSNKIESLSKQIDDLSYPFIILQRTTKFYYRENNLGKIILVNWDTPSSINTIVLANERYWADIQVNGMWKRGIVELIADWDSFRAIGTSPYPIQQGVVRLQTIFGSQVNSHLGTALVDF
jgi:cell division protein FtsL